MRTTWLDRLAQRVASRSAPTEEAKPAPPLQGKGVGPCPGAGRFHGERPLVWLSAPPPLLPPWTGGCLRSLRRRLPATSHWPRVSVRRTTMASSLSARTSSYVLRRLAG